LDTTERFRWNVILVLKKKCPLSAVFPWCRQR
jgi:hypothetical protein